MEAADRERVLLAGVVCAILFAQVLLYPGLPNIVTALGGGGEIGGSQVFLAVEFAAYILFASVWGAVSDATGRRAGLVAVAAVGAAAGYLALAALPALGSFPFEVVLAVRAFQGAMTIGALSLGMTMLMDLPGGHGRNMGAAGIAIGAGVALGSPVGGQLADQGALFPLWAAGGVMLLSGLAVVGADDRVPARARTGVRSVRDVISSLTGTPSLSIPYAFGFIDRLTAGFFALVGTFFFLDVFGLGPAERGLALALFFVPFALLQYPFGKLSDRIGRRIPVVVGSITYGIGVAAVGIAGWFELLSAAAAAMIAVGILGALMAPATMALVTDLAGEDQRGAAMGGFNIFGSLGFFVGIVAGGTLADSMGYLTAFLVVGLLEISIALLALGPLLRVKLPVEDTVPFR